LCDYSFDWKLHAGVFFEMDNTSHHYMEIALEEAAIAGRHGEVPVGAVIVNSETKNIVAQTRNSMEELNDPTAHAEMQAIRKAAFIVDETRLVKCDIYVTLEPCPMCAQAISFARLRRVYFGAYDPKGGGIDHGPRIFEQPSCHHRPEIIGGLCETDSILLLKNFFSSLR